VSSVLFAFFSQKIQPLKALNFYSSAKLRLPIITEIFFSSFFGACTGIAFTFIYPKKSREQQNNIQKKETNDILTISEKIVNRAYKIDRWGRRLFGLVIILLGLIVQKMRLINTFTKI
jgi:hypothetical protein